jgi:hypothetical protein
MGRTTLSLIILSLVCTPLPAQIVANSYAGTYSGSGPDSSVVLTLKATAQGKIAGVLQRNGVAYQVEADPGLDDLMGIAISSQGRLSLEGHREQHGLRLAITPIKVGGQPDYQHLIEMALTRAENASSRSSTASSTVPKE